MEQVSNEIKTVIAFIEAINRHDLVEISKLMTEDHTFIDPTGKSHAGRETMTAGWQQYFLMFPDYVIHVEKVFADKGVAAAFGVAAGTYAGHRGLVAENRIAMPAAWKAVVEDGRVKLWQVYADWTQGCKIMEEDSKAGQ